MFLRYQTLVTRASSRSSSNGRTRSSPALAKWCSGGVARPVLTQYRYVTRVSRWHARAGVTLRRDPDWWPSDEQAEEGCARTRAGRPRVTMGARRRVVCVGGVSSLWTEPQGSGFGTSGTKPRKKLPAAGHSVFFLAAVESPVSPASHRRRRRRHRRRRRRPRRRLLLR